MEALLFIVLLSTIPSAYSFECVGTCYSGSLSLDPTDVYEKKQLQGFTFKTVFARDRQTCYRFCTQDCRCKACQIQGMNELSLRHAIYCKLAYIAHFKRRQFAAFTLKNQKVQLVVRVIFN